MVLAIAFESIVKLVAILAVGYYAIYLLMGQDSQNTFSEFVQNQSIKNVFSSNTSTWASFLTKTLLATSAIFLLPRQFQVTVVEARDHHQFKTAMWVMPVYMILTSVIVLPIALTGSVLLPSSQADLYVLSLPLTAGNNTLAMVAFIGGLSAATGMVIVAAISLSTMVCNDLVMPYLMSQKRFDILRSDNLNGIILLIRRVVIAGLITGAYGYYILIDNNALLANIGLVSFAAIVQLLPAVLCALYWRSANRKGVFWGLIGGFIIWAYSLMFPTIVDNDLIDAIYSAVAWLHPQAFFGMRFDNSLSHGVFWSLLVNVSLLIFFSLRANQNVLEKIQASRFFFINDSPLDLSSKPSSQALIVHPDALRILTERIIGRRNTQALFTQFEQSQGVDLRQVSQVDRQLLSLVQTAVAGVIGSTSAQKVISDTLLGGDDYLEEGTAFVDETTSVLQFNRNLLQTTLENITHGISVIDRDLNLVIWNDQYLKLFDYPENLMYVGKPLSEVLRFNAERGDFGDKSHDLEINKRIKHLEQASSYSTVRRHSNGKTIKATGEPMPGGGFVTTYEDISESVRASEMLKHANEQLESRVKERTKELEVLTKELERSTRDKTHLLAAASHDLLQPINAARLFTHSISERAQDPAAVTQIAENIDKSLVTANELLRALLDVSRLDSGGIQPEYTDFSLNVFIRSLVDEMQASADDKKVILDYTAPDVMVYSDKKLLLPVLQNLVANGLRYSDPGGMVLVKASLLAESQQVEITVEDKGVGIDADHLDQIFNEFYQIKKEGREETHGLGLGLSIVKRISRLLDLGVTVESQVGHGSRFSIYVPFTDKPVVTSAVSPTPTGNLTESLRGAQILCLDNDESVLEAMSTLLEEWGAIVTSVATYKRAVDALSEVDFDLVLADYRLDYGETGLDFLKLADIKGALLTAEQDKSLRSQASELGYQYLAKPIEPAALKAVLLFLLDNES